MKLHRPINVELLPKAIAIGANAQRRGLEVPVKSSTRLRHDARKTYSQAWKVKMSTAVEIVEKFWQLMMSNDFRSVGVLLADDFVLAWPQSKERIRGRDNFAAMNEQYPAHGRWQFTIHRIVGTDTEAVSDVSVTDGVQQARAISFFTISDGKISQIIEFWPDPFEAAENRKHLVERDE